MAQIVKNPPAMRETRVPSLGGEDPLEEGMATHSRILAWRIPWTEEPGKLQCIGHKESDTTERLTVSVSTLFTLLVYIVSSPYNIHHMKLTSYSMVQLLHHFFR